MRATVPPRLRAGAVGDAMKGLTLDSAVARHSRLARRWMATLASPSPAGFVVRLLLLWSPLATLPALGPIKSWLADPLGRVYARVVSVMFDALGVEHARQATVLAFPDRGFSFEIAPICTGYFVFWFYLGAVLAFPASWRDRVTAVIAGAAFLFALNVVRILSLYGVQVWRPQWFHEAHFVVWQSLVIVLIGVFWYGWASHRRPSPRPAAA